MGALAIAGHRDAQSHQQACEGNDAKAVSIAAPHRLLAVGAGQSTACAFADDICDMRKPLLCVVLSSMPHVSGPETRL
jgi:hypothetical protein